MKNYIQSDKDIINKIKEIVSNIELYLMRLFQDKKSDQSINSD
jgi:hypothetical protein